MNDIAIRADNLGKRYRIGERQRYRALRDVLAQTATAPLRLFRASEPQPSKNGAGHIWALKDVSVEVRQGEVVGIIGRNGAGKSTLLKILARVTKPTEGFAKIRGRIGSLLEVGTGFHAELTGRENVYLSGAILGMKKGEIARKFDEIVAFADVGKFIDTPLKHFSTGMQMRLAFAVAAHLDPEVLLVDEVLAVGDAAFQKKCIGKIGDVSRHGRTIIFVSHNMTAMRSLATRAYLLEGGKVVLAGSAGECIERYLGSTLHGSAAEIDTRHLTRPGPEAQDATFRITSVRLEGERGQHLYFAGKPLTAVMHFEVSNPVREVSIGVAVYSRDGVRIFDCISNESLGPLPELGPASYLVRCTLASNPLNPGWYSLHVGARCESKSLDYLPDVMTFQVELGEKQSSTWLEQRWGYIRQESEWSIPEPVVSPEVVSGIFGRADRSTNSSCGSNA